MKNHPYVARPDWAYWRRAFDGVAMADTDFVVGSGLEIKKTDKVMTAGSCFAQHISKSLQRSGFGFLVTEPPHPIFHHFTPESDNYGVYTARYGNIYTSRQLCQLFKRAYGTLTPVEIAWQRPDGRYVDPFRPEIRAGGYASVAEVEADRTFHLERVREAFEQLDVLVFTLGLTETWSTKEDGIVYPLCPGVVAGTFDAERHVFVNLSVADVVADMRELVTLLLARNGRAKVILTVSPVPLVATATNQHVLAATTYSKSVLRVAAQELVAAFPAVVTYFPSYEVITGNYARGSYFEADLRNVRPEGVQHVMGIFSRHMLEAGEEAAPAAAPASPDADKAAAVISRQAELVKLVCEEEALDPGNDRTSLHRADV